MDLIDNYMQKLIDELNEELINSIYQKIPTGKKLRSKLIIKIAGENKNSIKLSSIIELIHMASLLHDDVIDEADKRRGVSSINALFGDKTAIMLGDILYSKAFFELADMDKNIAKIVSEAVTKLSIGELLDVEMSREFNSEEEKYYNMIYKKTASLIEASSASASILANRDIEKYKVYGKNLGIAFQIIDDILDIISDSKTLGKPALNDFREGKTTLPYIYLYHSLNEEDKNRLKSLFKKELDESSLNWIKGKMREHNCIERSIKRAKELGNEALEVIKDEKNGDLEKIIKDMIEREY